MVDLVQDSTFTDNCPKCGKRIEKSIAWLKQNNAITCPVCGTEMAVDPNVVRSLEKATQLATQNDRAAGT